MKKFSTMLDLLKCLAVGSHLTLKTYVDQSIDESTLVTNSKNTNFDKELANKKYIDDELDRKNLRFNQSLQNYLKV